MKKTSIIYLGILVLALVIGIPSFVSALPVYIVNQGGTGTASFKPSGLIVSGSTYTSALSATYSPTVNNITATGTAASILPYASTTALTISGNSYLGTISSGLWNGTTIGTTFGGTGLTTYNQGDLIYSSASNVLSVLSKSTSATRYLSNTGTSNNPAWAQISLTQGVTGTLPVANGGTASTSLSGILIGDNAGTVNTLTIGTNLTLVGTTLSASGSSPTFYVSTSTSSGDRVVGPISVTSSTKCFITAKMSIAATENIQLKIKQSTYTASTTLDQTVGLAGSVYMGFTQANWVSTTTESLYFEIISTGGYDSSAGRTSIIAQCI